MSLNVINMECRMGVSQLQLPIVVYANKNLSAESKILFTTILNISGETGLDNCTHSNEEFADEIGSTPESIEKSVDELIRHKYITKHFDKENNRILRTDPNFEVTHVKIWNYFNLKYVWGEI